MLSLRLASALVLLAGFGVSACPQGATPPAQPPATPNGAPANTENGIEISVGPEGVSLFAVAADAHQLLVRLARETGLRLIVDDTVKRTITVNFVNRKVSDVLNSIVSTYGLSCREVGGITMVSEGIPKGPSTYLLSDIDAISTQYVLAPNAKSLLPVFLQDHVKTNGEQNSVILSAPPDVLRKFREDIKQFDIPADQIMIDVLMVEFSGSSSTELGLNWDWSAAKPAFSADPAYGDIVFRTLTDLPRGFTANLHALVTKGKARVRANPRIATVSGQNASIFIGKQRYLSTPVAMSSSDYYSQTNSIDAGVQLNMTPWTGGAGEIIVDIRPEISVLSAPDAKTGLPDKSTRRANTSVHVRDGETIIIGGLLQNETMKTRTKAPILGDIPLLGGLFRTTDERETTTEMVIFITPRILSRTGHMPGENLKNSTDLPLPDEPKAPASR